MTKRTRYALPFVAIITLLILQGCGSSAPAGDATPSLLPVQTTEQLISDRQTEQSLADYLRRQSGITIIGSGDDIRVRIRGISSVRGADDPLFVIDGQVAGNSYRDINNRLSPRQIDRVRVLKGPDSATYGIRGGNGVIQIFTKRH